MPKEHIVVSALHPGMWVQYRTNKQWHYGQVKSWHQKHDMTMVTIAEYPSQHQITRPGLHLFAMSREQIPLRTQPGVSTIRRHMLQTIDQWITQDIIRVDSVPRPRGWTLGVRPYAWSQWTQYFPENTFDLIDAVTQWVRTSISMRHPRTRGPREVYTLHDPLPAAELDALSQAAQNNVGKADEFLEAMKTEKRREHAALQPRFGHNSLQRGQFWNRNPDYDPMDDDDP